MNKKCPVCKSSDFEIREQYRANHSMYKRLKRAECLKCGMSFATPMPSQNAINDYNSSYFDTAHGGISTSLVTKAFFSAIARLRVGHIESYLNKHKISVFNVLECGPGPGFLARCWLKNHPDNSYRAIETDKSCHATLNEIGVRLVTPHNNNQDSDDLDLVIMSHVLEHVSEPDEFIIDACRKLRKGGALFIEVPCNDWKHKAIDEPHLLFFDKDPMNLLLSSLGFVDIQLSYHGKTIKVLQKSNMLRVIWMKIRTKLIAMGVVIPFSRRRAGMGVLDNPLERAAVAPFKAHCETKEPAWWLRAVATKS